METQTTAAAPTVRPSVDGGTDDPVIDALAAILARLAREQAAGQPEKQAA